MNWDRFSNKIKRDLRNYESNDDGLDIWDAIESDVNALNNNNRKKKKRRFLFLLFFLVGASSVAYFIYQQDTFTATDIVEIQNDINKEPNHGLKSQSEVNKDSDTTNGSNSIIDSNNTVHKNNREAKRNYTAKNINTIENNGSGQNVLINPIAFQDKANDFNEKINLPKSAFFTESNTLSVNTTLQQPITSSIKNAVKLTQTSVLDQTANTSSLVSKINLPLLQNIYEDFPTLLPTKDFIFKEKVEVKTPPRRKFAVGFDLGYIYTNKELSANRSDVEDFLQRKDNTEKTLEALHASLKLEYAINSNLSIISGLDYTRINESFSFLEIGEEEVSTIIGTKYVVTGTGQNPTNLDEMGAIDSTTITLTDYRLFNHYELIDIPILLSYKWNHKKWSFGVQAGIFANLRFNGKGRILDTIQISDDIANIDHLKANLGVSYTLNMLFEYHLNSSTSFTLRPGARYFPNDFTNEDYLLKEKYQFVGADLGISYYF